MHKNTIKFIKSLHLKKFRKEEALFLVEGEKSIMELVRSDFEILNIYLTQEMYDTYVGELREYEHMIEIVSIADLERISTLEFNDTGLAVVKQKANTQLEVNDGELVLVLDDIRDPGNLGTIIRTADWYGVKKIVCSLTTAEVYNTKVIAASMGSFTRVAVCYTELHIFLENQKEKQIPILGALLNGTDVHTFSYPQTGILMMGNESNGIHESLLPYITHKVTIPRYGNAESLNVSMATGIILDNWKRS